MTIVYLNPIGDIGGAEKSLLTLLDVMGKSAPTINRHVILGSHGPLVEQINSLGASVEVLPFPGSLRAMGDSGLRHMRDHIRFLAAVPFMLAGVCLYILRLRKQLRSLRPAIVHTNGMKMHLLGALGKPTTAKLIWHIRDYPSRRPVMRHLLRLLASRSTLAIANSKSVANDVKRTLATDAVVQIYNAIDTCYFRPSVMDAVFLDDLCGLPAAVPGTIRVGMVGTYARWKGQDVFIRAAALVQLSRPVRFYVVGGPIYSTNGAQFSEGELRGLARSLAVDKQLGFVPFQRDIRRVYQSLDVVVHASTLPEPFGLVIAEAMSAGKPVVIADAGGASELFTDGIDGLGFPPGRADLLAARIQSLIDNDMFRTQLGEAARLKATTAWSLSRMGDEMMTAYRAALAVQPV